MAVLSGVGVGARMEKRLIEGLILGDEWGRI